MQVREGEKSAAESGLAREGDVGKDVFVLNGAVVRHDRSLRLAELIEVAVEKLATETNLVVPVEEPKRDEVWAYTTTTAVGAWGGLNLNFFRLAKPEEHKWSLAYSLLTPVPFVSATTASAGIKLQGCWELRDRLDGVREAVLFRSETEKGGRSAEEVRDRRTERIAETCLPLGPLHVVLGNGVQLVEENLSSVVDDARLDRFFDCEINMIASPSTPAARTDPFRRPPLKDHDALAGIILWRLLDRVRRAMVQSDGEEDDLRNVSVEWIRSVSRGCIAVKIRSLVEELDVNAGRNAAVTADRVVSGGEMVIVGLQTSAALAP